MKLIINVVGYELDGNTECVIPDGALEIKESTFRGCKEITSLIIPKSVNKIGASAFRDCVNLESVVIDSSDIKIGALAFDSCKKLKKVVFDKSCNLEMEGNAFSGCELLEEIIIPNSLTEIKDFSFNDCINLSNIILPDNLEKINYMAFAHCESLKKIIIPNGVKEIGNGAFSNCANLISVTIPDNIREICYDAFANCDNIQNVSISPYKINLLKGKIELVAIFSILKNYYNENVKYTEDEIKELKGFIRKNRIKLFPHALITNIDLYRFMFHEIDKIYNREDIEELFNKLESEKEEDKEFTKISKVEVNSFLLAYIHNNNNLYTKPQELTLDDLDNDIDDDEKGSQKKLTN